MILKSKLELFTSQSSISESQETGTEISTSLAKSSLPIMNQDEFISFWRIIYNLFTNMENEAEMYHAAATVSTLLLKLGEVSRKFQNSDAFTRSVSGVELKTRAATSSDLAQSVENSDLNDDADLSKIQRSSTVSEPFLADLKYWCITFEQLIASLLTDNLLVQYFDAKYDIDKKLNEYKSQHA